MRTETGADVAVMCDPRTVSNIPKLSKILSSKMNSLRYQMMSGLSVRTEYICVQQLGYKKAITLGKLATLI